MLQRRKCGFSGSTLNAVLKKLVDLGASGAVKYESSEYSNVLREDLADTLADSRECKLKVIEKFEEDLAKPPSPIAQDDYIETLEDTEVTFRVLDNDLNIANSSDSVQAY